MEQSENRVEEAAPRALLLGVLGCGGLGAVAGVDSGVFAIVRDAATLPVSAALVIAALLPALYVAASMTGLAIRASELGSALASGLRAAGLASLGLIAPVLFLLASTQERSLSRGLIAIALLFVAVLGLRALYARLFGSVESGGSLIPLFLLWSALFLGIAAKLSFGTLVI